MIQLKQGYTYLLKFNNKPYWHIVQRTGQKTWQCLQFTHCVEDFNSAMSGNSINLAKMIEERGVSEIHSFSQTAELRRAMFAVLKYGEILVKDDL